MAGRKRVNPLIIAVATALTVVIFLTDLSVSWGMAGGVPYVVLVLLGWWFQRRRDVYLLAGFASALTVAGYLLSPEGGAPWVALANRSLALLAIWGMAVLIAQAKGAQEALQTSNEELARRVKQRTRKMAEAIVERGRAQEAVREREQRLRLILDSMVVGVVTVDEMGVVQSFNPGAKRIFGYEPDEVTGKNVSMLMPRPHRSRHDTYIANYLRTGEAKVVGKGREVEGRRKDGSIFPIELEIGEMMVGGRRVFAGIVKDITERKRAEGKLRKSEEFFRGVVETLQEGFALYDADDRLVAVNDVFRRINPKAQESLDQGVTFEDMVRANVERGWIVEAQGREEEFLRERLEQHRNPGPAIIRQYRDGRYYKILESRTPEGGIALTYSDITELKQTEEALLTAKGEAEDASRAKSEFLAAMSHEFRTPLNAILGFADILSNQYFGPTSDKYQEYAEDIQASGEHLLTLVNDILDLSTIEAGKQSLLKEKLSTEEIVMECERIVEDKARSNGITLVTEVPEDLPPLYADKRAVKQILLNLLSNAVKFTPDGGKITVSVKASKKNTTLKVADTGRGIPAERLPKLTDPFTRAHIDPYLAEQGWGLGLSITKSLIDLHDGTLDIKSKVGKGTTVTVTFPNGAP